MTREEDDIEHCIRRGADQYFNSCRARIPAFIGNNFCYPGALKTNRVAFGWDLLRAPLNLFWAPVYALICILRYALSKSRCFSAVTELLNKTPSGFTTQVQSEISNLILKEIFHHQPDTHSLDENIIVKLQALYKQKTSSDLRSKKFRKVIEPIVHEALVQYQVTRTASADITNTLSCAVIGAFAFKKFTPGGIGIGLVIASVAAEKIAASHFIFGSTIGNVYYSLFPPEPSLHLLSISMISVTTILSVIAAFSGIVTDPIQARLGLHQKRLLKMVDALEKDFLARSRSSFRPKDQFIARILDAFDALKSGLI